MSKGTKGWGGFNHGSFAQSLRASKSRMPGAGRPREYNGGRRTSASLRPAEEKFFRHLEPTRGSVSKGIRLAMAHYLPYAWLFDPPPPSGGTIDTRAGEPLSLWLHEVDLTLLRQMGDRNVTQGLRELAFRLRFLPPMPDRTPSAASLEIADALARRMLEEWDNGDTFAGLNAEQRAQIDAELDRETAEVDASITGRIED